VRSFTIAAATSEAVDCLAAKNPHDPEFELLFPSSTDSARGATASEAEQRDEKGLTKADYAALYAAAHLKHVPSRPIRFGAMTIPADTEWDMLTRALTGLDSEKAANDIFAKARALSANNLGGPKRGRPLKDESPPKRGPKPPNTSRIVDALINLGFEELQKRLATIETARSTKRNVEEGRAQRPGRKASKNSKAGII
jgi:hypothetical protein